MTGGSRLDKATQEAAQTYLKAALEHMIATGRSVRDFSDFALEKFGDNFLPVLSHFLDDVHQGRVIIKGLSESAKTAILGQHVSPQEREEMIRQAAYFRSEQRGFTGGSGEEDWRAAEKEIDERLAKEVGLVETGRKVLTSATVIVEKELDSIKHVVASWLEGKKGSDTQKAKKTASKKKVASKKSTTPKKTIKAAKEKPTNKKTAAVKKVSKKKAVKKKTAGTTKKP